MGAVFTEGAYADTPQRDIEFAGGLVDLGFPDYADKIIKQVLLRNPGMEPQTKIVQAQILIGKGRFDDARGILESLPAGDPKAQAIELALAGAYYNMGNIDQARIIYEDFFKQYRKSKPSDPDLMKFYRESAYRFGQMLEDAGDYKGAADAYRKVLDTNPEKEIERRMKAECAKLYLMSAKDLVGVARDQVLQEAERLCTDLQWGALDIYFGNSISTMAHIQLMRGQEKEAQQTLEEYMDMLKQIDDMLKEMDMLKESPLAEARFMLGEMYTKQAENARNSKKDQEAIGLYGRALGEYYNVFVKYGESDFGPKAGLKAEEIKTILERDYDKEVLIDLGENKARMAKQAFKMGDTQFRNRNYKTAIEEYEKMLAHYPATPQSVDAIINLAQCYAHENDKLMAKATVGYLGEHFGDNERAPLGVLAVGKIYFDRKDQDAYIYVYDSYIDNFPNHEKAGAILYTLASMFRERGDQEKATRYFTRLVEDYPTDRYSIKALSNLAWTQYGDENYKDAIPGFINYLKTVQPGYDRARAQFSLADSYMKTDQYIDALKAFNTLIGWLEPEDSPYNNSVEAAEKNKKLYENAVFYRAYCCTQVDEPAKLVKPLRTKAIGFFQEFLEKFPRSDLAPVAMARMGGTQLELDQFDQAVKTFNDLAEQYPNSTEGENALFSLVRAAMEVEKYDVARDALNDMLARKASYSVEDFARIGQMMMDAGLYPETIQAYQQVQGNTDERGLLERALYGTGKAYYEQKQYDQAITNFEELMERYPKSGLFYDAKFVLGNAYKETGNSAKAIAALSDVFKFSDNAELNNRANLILGQVQLQQDDKDGALASFQRVALLGNPEDPAVKPLIEECILRSIPLMMELERYQDAQDSCDQYERLFPESSKIEQIRNIKREAKRKAAMSA
jgi:tetratricopeptide (TPR) repeat protein